jgi:hypothetical protein
MTFTEAVKELSDNLPKGDLWMRPVGSVGYGYALATNGLFLLVPTARGGIPAIWPSAKEICGPWEVVSPDVVLDKRN